MARWWMSEILVINYGFAIVPINVLWRDRQMGSLPKTRRDASKSWTGSRRRHNTRKIAIGGTRLDSRLSDFRPATKSAENRECALNGSVSVFVDLRLHLHGSSDTLSPSSTSRRKGSTATNGFIQALVALYSLHLFARSMFIIYVGARHRFLCRTKAGQ